jgi:hypothetical protein
MSRLFAAGEPIEVVLDAAGLPQRFGWRGEWHPIDAIANRWRVRATWWSVEAWREFYKVTTTDRILCVIYLDLQSEAWFLERLYD